MADVRLSLDGNVTGEEDIGHSRRGSREVPRDIILKKEGTSPNRYRVGLE